MVNVYTTKMKVNGTIAERTDFKSLFNMYLFILGVLCAIVYSDVVNV